jgi:hypothetical protein
MRSALREAKPIDNIVQTSFENLKQVHACQPSLLQSRPIITTELSLGYAINPLCLLLLAQLPMIIRNSSSAELGFSSMFTWRIATSFKGAFWAETSLTLEKKLLALTATKFANWSCILRHIN